MSNFITKLFNQSLVSQQWRNISTSGILFAEPPRKKRRIDPAVFRTRVEKKMRKLEREVAKLESEPKQFVPILEYELTNSELRDLKARPKHNLAEFGLSEGAIKAAGRLWNIYRREQVLIEAKSIRRVVQAQEKALADLKELDIKLYNSTLEIDEVDTLIPYRSSHMRKETPPNPSYVPPDGYIKDTTKEWVM